jgi:hypothetical protein
MAKSGINKTLLRKVRNHILAEPRRYCQSFVAQSSKDAPCGTVACIAGWADFLANGTDIVREDGYDVMVRAGKVLGLPEEQWEVLFGFAFGWPEPFRARYYENDDPHNRARAAADLINQIIRTGKVK